MEMHQIRYFLALAEVLNFTRAADLCNVSQPALTRAVKLLEEEFGGPLFHRERANTHLSELGRMVHPHLKQVYDEAHAAKQIALDAARLKKAPLRLGIMCTIAPNQLVELIGAIRMRHPGIELEISDRSARVLDTMLLEGDLDVAVYCLPGGAPDARLHVMPLYRERMLIVIPPNHALARRKAIRVRDLDGMSYINRANCEFNGYAGQFFRQQSVTCRTVYSSERDDWVLAMIRSGLGFGFMPELSVTDPAVIARPLIEPEFSRTINLCTVRGRPFAPAVGAFVREAMRVRWMGESAVAVAEIVAAHGSEAPVPAGD
ncbi:LysR family transcriptional regulator [Rhodoplanes roseus]|uniref:LysR family transcriptional regulator n=1 Tax=Rhodoplanes roseus TaxID=29409 RepID=A0A327KYW1_9BRAD|nr:LysR family transcriptional regulator [Rhodoplanes roseus]RAI42795.1 LysR family transcriptional regulator [Rhodoplanes roseus]